LVAAARPQPSTVRALRRPSAFESHPENTRETCAVASVIPSTIPSTVALAPRVTTRKIGSSP
jgi:hypothetical protein